MFFDPHLHIRRAAHLGIPAFVLCLGLLSPVAASGNARPASGASTSPSSTADASSPSNANLESTIANPEPVAAPSAEPGPGTSGEARLARREERRKQREERRAARAAEGEAGCTIDLEAPAPVTAGDPASLLGHLSCPAADVAAQTVTFYQKVPHTSGFVLAGTATTEADGAFQFAPSELHTNSIFYATADNLKSNRTHLRITPAVTLNAPAAGTQLFVGAARGQDGTSAGKAVTFTGTISPVGAGAVVALQREDGGDGRWHQVALGQVGAQGAYSITHVFHRAGKASIRVVVHFRGLDTRAASNPVAYQISRRQHEQLTIEASSQTISYGQSVTIGGTVAGAISQPVTLLAQTSTGTFEPVAQSTTNGSGEYTFTASPVQDSRYRVTWETRSSVTQPVNVAYALTAEPAASTIQAGGQLTVSGNVNPSQAGQGVRLERQNSSGVGFHVVASGTVSSGSTYSITVAVPQPGTDLIRVTVPGYASNASASSAPFSVQVTPASG